MEFLQLDVFAARPYEGNPLAVVLDAADLSAAQMQSIAREMNLSETTFVMDADKEAYTVRIFTPAEELPFAGHPTLGTAWVLKHLGVLSGDDFRQYSSAGVTIVRERDGYFWFERSGNASADVEDRDPEVNSRLARSLGLETDQIGLEAREFGRSGRLRVAWSDAGVSQLMVPVRDQRALQKSFPSHPFDLGEEGIGIYCFTGAGAGKIAARGFFPDAGITEDPATGSAAAALGLYLADRVGDIRFEIAQGVEMGRPSHIYVDARSEGVEVGGRCELVLRGEFDVVP
jgi:trans-2,3-dihydro-3-hydroxyanthranilate isomerase